MSNRAIIALILMVLGGVVVGVPLSQALVERDALSSAAVEELSGVRQIDKLEAEIRKIRSETAGSLFWLKLTGVLVTVGGAVSGYLFGQSRLSRLRISFENAQLVDQAYERIVSDLSHEEQVLRAAAAAKLGSLLEGFPEEWGLSDARAAELRALTKSVLSTALSVEQMLRVRKALTIALVRHPDGRPADLSGADLSYAQAADAFWARVDFTHADFYQADLSGASFRGAKLASAQFRDTDLRGAVLASTNCEDANFKNTDLRGADLRGAKLDDARFENARVHGLVLDGRQQLARIAAEGLSVNVAADEGEEELVVVDSWVRSIP